MSKRTPARQVPKSHAFFWKRQKSPVGAASKGVSLSPQAIADISARLQDEGRLKVKPDPIITGRLGR